MDLHGRGRIRDTTAGVPVVLCVLLPHSKGELQRFIELGDEILEHQ